MTTPPMPIMPPHFYHQHSPDAFRPSLGFPLGTTLLLIVFFTLSGILSCCYHSEKFRSLRQIYAAATADDLEHGPSADKAKASVTISKERGVNSLPVIMPGDQMPRFIALPCPCAPLRPEKHEEIHDDAGALPKPASSLSFVPTTTTAPHRSDFLSVTS